MKTLLIALGALLLMCALAFAADDSACNVAAGLVHADFPLERVAAAVARKDLKIVVVGSASSTLGGPSGGRYAYPARLEATLAAKLPQVAVKVVAYAKGRETAGEMEKQFAQILATDKPALIIWQTGTVEAMRRSDPDEFRAALDDGIDAIQSGNSDVLLMNMQYSPRTESMILVPPYADAMRFVALQHEVLLFDRFAVMKHWGELGTFDLNEVTKKIDMAEQVHDCIGRLLADLIIAAEQLPKAEQKSSH